VTQLHAQLAARTVHRIGEATNARDVLVIGKCRLMSRRCPNRPGNRSSSGNNHGRSTSGAGLIVGNLAITDFTFNTEIHIHGGQENPIG
jgi:hypothetical protein